MYVKTLYKETLFITFHVFWRLLVSEICNFILITKPCKDTEENEELAKS